MFEFEKVAMEIAEKYGFSGALKVLKRRRVIEKKIFYIIILMFIFIVLMYFSVVFLKNENIAMIFFIVLTILIFSLIFIGVWLSKVNIGSWEIRINGVFETLCIFSIMIFIILFWLIGIMIGEINIFDEKVIITVVSIEIFLMVILFLMLYYRGINISLLLITRNRCLLDDIIDCINNIAKSVDLKQEYRKESKYCISILYKNSKFKVSLMYLYMAQTKRGLIWVSSTHKIESIEYAFKVASLVREKCL